MLVTLVLPERDLFLPQEVDPSLKLKEVLMVISVETGWPEDQITFHHDGKPVASLEMTFSEIQIKDGDVLVVARSHQKSSATTSTQIDDTEQFRQYILGNEAFQQQISQIHPGLLEAALTNSPQFKTLVRQLQSELSGRPSFEAEKAALYRTLALDPFNVEAQKRIEELIKEENIASNMDHALEFHPESFGQVHMLYINTEVNGHPVKTFVDCGAQTTIMTMKCAEKCQVTRLIDTRFSGIAKGVGEGRILGRVHSVILKLGSQHLPCSLTILEGDGPDILFGLDMLKRHQVNINLKTNKMEINEEGIDFLPEHEIPK